MDRIKVEAVGNGGNGAAGPNVANRDPRCAAGDLKGEARSNMQPVAGLSGRNGLSPAAGLPDLDPGEIEYWNRPPVL